MRADEVELHEHSDRDEEQRNEHIPKRQQLRQRLVTVVGLRDHQSCEKRPQCERCSGLRRAEGGEGPEQDDRDQEQLSALRLEDLGEQGRDDRAGQDGDTDHNQGRLPQGQCELGATAARSPGEKRQRQHDRDDAQILEYQHAGGEAAVWGVDLALVRESLEHEGGTRESGQAS